MRKTKSVHGSGCECRDDFFGKRKSRNVSLFPFFFSHLSLIAHSYHNDNNSPNACGSIRLIISILFQSVPLRGFKEFLLTFKPYLFGESESVFVLVAFLLVTRVQPDVDGQHLTFADMPDFIFRLFFHRPLGIGYGCRLHQTREYHCVRDSTPTQRLPDRPAIRTARVSDSVCSCFPL